jgi:hypothetical protein
VPTGPEWPGRAKSGVSRGFSVYCSCLRWKRRLKQHPAGQRYLPRSTFRFISESKIKNKEVCNTYGARNSKVV